MLHPQQINPDEIASLILQVIGGKTTDTQAAAASSLAVFLSDVDEFSEAHDINSRTVREIIERSKPRLSPKSRALLDDMIAVALARIDIKSSLEYWLKDDNGEAITLTQLQCFELDFMRYAHEEVMVPITFAPMGSGKSSMMVGIKAYEIGRDQNVLEQLVCSSDKPAEKRGTAIRNILESPHFRKVFPHIKRHKEGPWTNHELLVIRTKADMNVEVTKTSRGDSGSIDPTLACYGVTSGGLGSRANFSDFDDLATYENSIKSPSEGQHINGLLTTKWFTRKKSPLGVKDVDYDRKKNPWRGRVIGTPWAYDDCIYSLRDWDGAAVVLIGVNDTFTAYNVQMWGLPDKYIERLRKKYATGTVDIGTLPEVTKEQLRKRDCAAAADAPSVYTLGPGMVKDRVNPPKATMEIPLSRPRQWYIEEFLNAKDPKMDFDRPYRCEVYTEGELAFPGFENSLFLSYPDYCKEHNPQYEDVAIPIEIVKLPVYTTRNGRKEQTGYLAKMANAPKDYRLKIAMIDLSGVNRIGTVITTAVLTQSYRRRVVEIVRGAWAGSEITDQVTELFGRHDDLLLCYIESVSLQKLFVDEAIKHKEFYPWWPKIAYFDETVTKKNDQQIGILTMGTSYARGGFELPDTWNEQWRTQGHGRNCPCGYCRIIEDATIQTRLAPVKSDVLITLWGIHISMPHSFEVGTPTKPEGYQYAKSGYELLKGENPLQTEVGRALFGRKGRLLGDKVQPVDDGWGSPRSRFGLNDNEY